MGVTVGVLKESLPGERRVAMVPRGFDALQKLGHSLLVEQGAGLAAGFPDTDYASRGARVTSRADVLEHATLLLQVRVNAEGAGPRHTIIGFCDPLSEPRYMAAIAQTGASLLSVEMVPRITRAQSMDALSSMASIAGYKAVLLAADTLPRMFPMMMTAAGTIPPARVLIIGAGVAGLQAIATARRLGAVVMGYDVRAAVKEQIESLGAKFLQIDVGTKGEGEGGYARALDEESIRHQREQLALALKEQDVVITTAAVPGRKAPLLITKEMVAGMSHGSVIIDIAAERGGNCELTQAGKTVDINGVSIVGPVNLPSAVPYHASMMYARNLATLVKHLTNKEGELVLNTEDEITRETLITKGGEVVHPKVRALLESSVPA